MTGIDKDLGVLIALGITVASGLLTTGGLISLLRRVVADVKKLEKDLNDHVRDVAAHVNHAYLKSVDDRIAAQDRANDVAHSRLEDKLERMEDKIDRVVERLMEM